MGAVCEIPGARIVALADAAPDGKPARSYYSVYRGLSTRLVSSWTVDLESPVARGGLVDAGEGK